MFTKKEIDTQCAKVSEAAEDARNSFTQRAETLDVLRRFATLGETLNDLTSIFQEQQEDVRALLNGQYSGLISDTESAIREATTQQFWNLNEIRENCEKMRVLLAIIRHKHASRSTNI